MMIVNDDYRFVNKLEASLTDDVRVVIYDHQMFIVQATGVNVRKPLLFVTEISYSICAWSIFLANSNVCE
jgi:hypothetical protein